MKTLVTLILIACTTIASAQSDVSKILTEIATAPSADRIEKDVRTLVNFGTRHTLSDTVSKTRGIGAARRWIKSEFDNISKACDDCLEVSYQRNLVPKDNRRIVKDTYVVNVLATQRGTKYPNSYVIMSGDIDSRVSDANNFTSDSPGANDNASGMAGTIEAARVLSAYKFPVSIIYVGLSGEEQGLFGGQYMAKVAKEEGWNIVGVINNDMIGNIKGIDGVIDNSTFRVFSEAISMATTDKQRAAMRYYGGEVDGPSRQLARYIDKITDDYMTNLDAIMIYRLDRFGRGGHHRPFNDAGFTGVRIMETHENYNQQHQDIRTENGIKYGDVLEAVNFDYASKLTAVNALTLASLASAPLAPKNVKIGGVVQPSTQLQWDEVKDDHLIGYKIYWRDTTSPQWQYSRFIGKVTAYALKNIVIDNYLFGVASIGKNGAESLVQFPNQLIGRD
ncbi:M28 family metallopeptidase [Aureibaculum sp. A20]|uniref:M28 family metallopeptidase n=1 Tax=Aureibaculum flavum TaxID=2795986 RepID=A0ABS0WM39_9FLAO|nr:M28 family metallopeptidase [Aureibaculum flavum]MBJ2173031.1 M28 family metallopeptidase [Aureibaculum flavum]